MESPELQNILKTIKIFEGMKDVHISEIIPLLKPMSCPTDTPVIHEGESGESMYIIKRGQMKVTRSQDDGDEIYIGILTAGGYFGELSLIDNLPRSANVVTIEDSEILQLDKKDFDNLLETNGEISRIFYRQLPEGDFREVPEQPRQHHLFPAVPA